MKSNSYLTNRGKSQHFVIWNASILLTYWLTESFSNKSCQNPLKFTCLFELNSLAIVLIIECYSLPSFQFNFQRVYRSSLFQVFELVKKKESKLSIRMCWHPKLIYFHSIAGNSEPKRIENENKQNICRRFVWANCGYHFTHWVLSSRLFSTNLNGMESFHIFLLFFKFSYDFSLLLRTIHGRAIHVFLSSVFFFLFLLFFLVVLILHFFQDVQCSLFFTLTSFLFTAQKSSNFWAAFFYYSRYWFLSIVLSLMLHLIQFFCLFYIFPFHSILELHFVRLTSNYPKLLWESTLEKKRKKKLISFSEIFSFVFPTSRSRWTGINQTWGWCNVEKSMDSLRLHAFTHMCNQNLNCDTNLHFIKILLIGTIKNTKWKWKRRKLFFF